jgi:hypothetical protein
VWPPGAYICCLFPLQPAHIVEESVMSGPDRSVSVRRNTLMHCKASPCNSCSH